ncbi:MAG: LacI family DNA-binding transcriptional regulator [Eubacterium sp.]|nr:LacI family DNA-binding transcriptional regulator [Eubacterium sp.]
MSIKKIAALAGTSTATVSRVLNQPDHRCHNKELADKIWNIAKELNYTPNASARALRCGKEKTERPFVVDIFLTRFDSMDQDAFFQEIYQNLKEELLENGCVLGEVLHAKDVITLGQETRFSLHIPYKTTSKLQAEQQQHPLAFVEEKNNTGLIILGKCQSNLIPILKKRYRCIAGIDRNPTEYEYDEVVCNGTTAAEMAVEYLLSLGHTNIAYIGDCTYESRYIGYYQTLVNHRIPLNHSNVHPTDQTKEAGYGAMKKILTGTELPTAIFCANDTTALGVLQALKEHKKRGYVPSIISIDNIKASEKTTPMLTTIHIPKKQMAHLALLMLLDRKWEKHEERIRVELPCRLVERDSCTFCVR